MGLTVHLSLDAVERPMSGKKHVERIGEYTVVTSSINMASPKQMLYKRLMDLAGGFVGCIITLFLIIIIGPMIYLKSPGPIFFPRSVSGRTERNLRYTNSGACIWMRRKEKPS